MKALSIKSSIRAGKRVFEEMASGAFSLQPGKGYFTIFRFFPRNHHAPGG
jgi:hypothetical protein